MRAKNGLLKCYFSGLLALDIVGYFAAPTGSTTKLFQLAATIAYWEILNIPKTYPKSSNYYHGKSGSWASGQPTMGYMYDYYVGTCNQPDLRPDMHPQFHARPLAVPTTEKSYSAPALFDVIDATFAVSLLEKKKMVRREVDGQEQRESQLTATERFFARLLWPRPTALLLLLLPSLTKLPQ